MGKNPRHCDSVRAFNTTDKKLRTYIDQDLDEAVASLSKSGEISMCSKDCPMFKKGKCENTGGKAPIGSDCILQRISREMSS